MSTVKSPFQYGSSSHTVLKYAAMKKNTVATSEGVMSVFPHRFSKPSRVKRCFDILTKHGLVVNIGDGWKITSKGIQHLSTITTPYRGDEGFSRK